MSKDKRSLLDSHWAAFRLPEGGMCYATQPCDGDFTVQRIEGNLPYEWRLSQGVQIINYFATATAARQHADEAEYREWLSRCEAVTEQAQ